MPAGKNENQNIVLTFQIEKKNCEICQITNFNLFHVKIKFHFPRFSSSVEQPDVFRQNTEKNFPHKGDFVKRM